MRLHNSPTRLRRFRRRSWTDHLLFLEAILWLGIARVAVLRISFREIMELLQQEQGLTAGQSLTLLHNRAEVLDCNCSRLRLKRIRPHVL